MGRLLILQQRIKYRIEQAKNQIHPTHNRAFIAEDYRQLGGLRQELNKTTQQIYMLNAFAVNKQATLMSLIRLQSMGISEDQILKMDQFLQQYNGQQYIRQ
jgi:hypothetical protein